MDEWDRNQTITSGEKHSPVYCVRFNRPKFPRVDPFDLHSDQSSVVRHDCPGEPYSIIYGSCSKPSRTQLNNTQSKECDPGLN